MSKASAFDPVQKKAKGAAEGPVASPLLKVRPFAEAKKEVGSGGKRDLFGEYVQRRAMAAAAAGGGALGSRWNGEGGKSRAEMPDRLNAGLLERLSGQDLGLEREGVVEAETEGERDLFGEYVQRASPTRQNPLMDSRRTFSSTQPNERLIQRYQMVEGGAKVSQSGLFRASPDKKKAFVLTDRLATVQEALAGAENAKITVKGEGAETFGENDYTRIVPVMKDAYAEKAIQSQFELYRDAWNYIGRYEEEEGEGEGLSLGMQHFETFFDEEDEMEKKKKSHQIRIPLDCRAVSEHLQGVVSNAQVANPNVGSNYSANLNNNVGGTLKSALKGWNFHYASVIAKDQGEANTDNLSFEVGAEGWVGEVMNQIILRVAQEGDTTNLAKYAELLSSTVFGASLGRFDVYGTQEASQAFDYVTYCKLMHHMLDQIGVQMDLIPHDIEQRANPGGNLEKINLNMGLLENKIRELKETPDTNIEAINAGISSFVEGYELTAPLTPEQMLFIMSLLHKQKPEHEEKIAEEKVEEEEGAVLDEVVENEEVEENSGEEEELGIYSTEYKKQVLQILTTAGEAFSDRIGDLEQLGEGFSAVRLSAEGLREALKELTDTINSMNFVPDNEAQDASQEEMKAWTKTLYKAVIDKLAYLKTTVAIP